MTASTRHRLDGLEPDNLLAFLALLGLLRALEAADERQSDADRVRVRPRAAWDIDAPPVRPVLCVGMPLTPQEVSESVAAGLDLLVRHHDFGGRKDLNFPSEDARLLLRAAGESASTSDRGRAELLSALMTDAAVKDEKKDPSIVPTPLCLLFGQGHQHFLDRLASVPAQSVPPVRGRTKGGVRTAADVIHEALFEPWHRDDPTFSFRWDPDEDVRYALMAGDPTDASYKSGTQHGANRLAAVGLAVLTVVPQQRRGKVRPSVLGGQFDGAGFSMAWPVWQGTATLRAIQGLIGHPELRAPGALAHLGVDHVVAARRISVGKFMNFSRARPLT